MGGGRVGAVAAAVSGIFLSHLLEHLLGARFFTARAAWCWPAQPPKCDAPVVAGGSCTQGATIPEGQACAPQCTGNQVPSCSKPLQRCPASIPGGNPDCFADFSAGTWWTPCGFGTSCAQNLPVDGPTWECLPPGSPVDSQCASGGTPPPKPRIDDPTPRWDAATVAAVCSFFVWALLCALVGRMAAGKAAQKLFWPGPVSWNVANGLGMLAVVIGLVAYAIVLAAGKKNTEVMFVLGQATGIALSLPLWWSFFRCGVHAVMGMSREAAWRIHIALGDVLLIFGTAHGISSLLTLSADTVFKDYTAGPVGLILMYLGVLPAALASSKLITYDSWKLLHFASFFGYISAFIHVLGFAVKFESTHMILLAIVNGLALALFVVQKVVAKITARSKTIRSADVVEEDCGWHVFLCLDAPGFSFAPGQWGLIKQNSILGGLFTVAHPFTIVPGRSNSEEVQFFIKVSGKFTANLAAACKSGTCPSISLEGPYGTPPLPAPWASAVVFVVGGVGITPALSLLPEACKSSINLTPIYWALRSRKLLERCSPLLEDYMNGDPSLNCIRLNDLSVRSGPSGGLLPLGAKHGSVDVGGWLRATESNLSAAGVQSVLLFVCGPASLASAAQRAISCCNSKVTWHLHVEQFLFLPKPPKVGSSKPKRMEHEPLPTLVGSPS